LQDLDLMIREARDPEESEAASRLGFRVDGLAALEAAREEIARGLERRVLRLYEVAAGRYQGRAVVPVRDRVCLGCSALQPTGFGGDSERVATCQSCGRILYPV
jgi:predicted  nucleic acid-binding Zn-ribbon protein